MPCTLPLPVSGVLLLVTSWRYDQMAQEPWACTAAMAASGAFCLWVSLHRGAEKRVWVPRAHGVLSAAFLLCAVGYALQQYQGIPSPIMARSMWLHAAVSFMASCASKGYAADLFPWWLRLLTAEGFVLSKTYALQGNHQGSTICAWSCFLVQQVAGVLLPLVIYPQQRRFSGAAATARTAPPQPTKATARMPLVPYESVLGERVTISIKVATRHQPEDLAPNALNNLARLVERFDMQDGRPLADMALGAAVRRGCVLISLTACNGQGRDSMTEAEALMHAQQLLPGLLAQLFPDCSQAGTGAGPASPCLEPGLYLQLRVGSHVVRASVHKDTHEWVFEVQPPVAVPSQPNSTLQLCLADAQPLQLVAADTGTGKTGVHAVPLTVHVRGGDIAFVRGSDPASSPAHDTDKPTPQLWVHCQGQYVQTVVHDVDSYTGTVQATAYVPSTALARHHQPDGPVARLQVLSLELWQGADTVLSRTSLVVDAAQHMQPDVPSSFGWWGALAAQAAGLVADVRSLTAAAAAGSDAAAASHQAFVSDLAVWLQAVQQAAPGTCCDMFAPAAIHSLTPTLTVKHMTTLASSLQRYAAQQALPQVAGFVQRTQPAACAATAGEAGAAGWARLCRQLTHTTCPQCDSIFYDALQRSLGSWAQYLGLLRTASCVWSVTEFTRSSVGTIAALLAASCLHAAATLWAFAAVRSQRPRPPTARHPHNAGCVSVPALSWREAGLFLVTYLAYLWLKLAILLGVLPTTEFDPQVCSIGLAAPAFAAHMVLAVVGQQMALWGRLPTWLVRSFVLLDASIGHRVMMRLCPELSRVSSYCCFVSIATVVPYVMHAHLRIKYSQHARILSTPRPAAQPESQIAHGK